jgi:hypothetical protein
MATQVSRWETTDGKLFLTEDAALKHEKYLLIANTINTAVPGSVSGADYNLLIQLQQYFTVTLIDID